MSKAVTMTDEQLIESVQSIQGSINMDCYSSHDLLEQQACIAELIERGYEIEERRETVLTIKKEDKEDD